MNRIATLTSCLIIAFACTQAAAAVSDEVSEDFEAEYIRIVKQIDYYSNAHKLHVWKRPPPQEQLLDVNCAILKTDRNPLDVALRRSEVLLKRLKAMRGAPTMLGQP